jgi:hypothetical protein
MARGNYTIKAVASTVAGEINTGNNVFIDGTVQVLWHDVAVTNVVSNTTWVYQGRAALINVTVLNKGDFPETVNVTLYYNITANKIVGTQNITLLVGESKTLLFVWDTTGVEYCHNYTITAVAEIVPMDNNMTNNVLADGNVKVRILGDINGDDTVDLRDVYGVALAFGTSPGDTRWDLTADINGDMQVCLRDFYIVCLNFGKSCSP